MNKDYYEILGVSKDASIDEIKSSYRKLSKKYHPDISGGSEDKFKEISQAYSVLSDTNKRREYDVRGSGHANFSFDDMFANMGGFNFDDIFGRSNRRAARPREDIRVTIDLTLDEVDTGLVREIKYKRRTNCQTCDGVGGTDIRTCLKCNGKGSRVVTSQTPIGVLRQQIACDNCSGTGEVVMDKCDTCHGDKHKIIHEQIKIDIPKGVTDDVLYKYEGKGHSNRFGTGDLLVHFNILPHKEYKRHGGNIIREIQVPFNMLVQGGCISIKGLNDKVIEVDIPAMTKPGYMLSIYGVGLPIIDEQTKRGDILLKIGLDFPDTISDQELDIISNLNTCPNFIYKQN